MNNVVNNETEEKNIIICEDCGKEIDAESGDYFETADGRIICYDCYCEDYFTCENCGKIHFIGDCIETSDSHRYFCVDCANFELYRCDDCDDWYEYTHNIFETTDGRSICYHCRDSYIFCDDCGGLFYEDDIEYCEDDGNYYCNNCLDSHINSNNSIKSYHAHKNTFEKRKTEKEAKTPLYFGFELEVEKSNYNATYTDDMAEIIDNIMQGDVVFEHDGSLSDGFEIISQPVTLKYIYKNKDKIEKMLKALVENGYISHNSEHCGLHIHLSRDYFTPNEIDKLQLIIEKFKKELIIFSRRGSSQQLHWAKFITDSVNDNGEKLNVDYIKKYKNKYDRYYALNLSNSSTIEFRLLRGTLKYNTFMASFELLNNMSKIAKNTSAKNIDNLKFEDIILYGKNNKHLKQYCLEKNLIKSDVNK